MWLDIYTGLMPQSTVDYIALVGYVTSALLCISRTSRYVAWVHNDVLLLIDSYCQHTHDFSNPTLRQGKVWNTIAQGMNVVKGIEIFYGDSVIFTTSHYVILSVFAVNCRVQNVFGRNMLCSIRAYVKDNIKLSKRA